MPSPKKGESKDDFIERCMGDDEANRDFPDEKQRYAFCNSQWERRGGQSTQAGQLFRLQTGTGLVAPGSTEELSVNRDTGVIENVSVITRGPATGHGFEIDDVMLKQVRDGIKAQGDKGIKCRLTHPEPAGIFTGGSDPVLFTVGRVQNPRIRNGHVRGDVKVYDYANKLPGRQGTKDFLLDVAEQDPAVIGMSIIFVRDDDEEIRDESDELVGRAPRVKEMVAVDFVGDPAANPDGLLSKPGPAGPQSKGGLDMDPKLRKKLEALGLAKEATDEQALDFLDGFDDKHAEEKKALEKEHADEVAKLKADVEAAKKLAESDDEPVDIDKIVNEKVQATLKAERERVAAIRAIVETKQLNRGWADRLIDEGTTVEDFTALAEAAEQNQPIAGLRVGANLNRSSLGPGIEDAIMLRAGVKLIDIDELTGQAKRDAEGRLIPRAPHDRAGQFRRVSLVMMMRGWLHEMGEPTAFIMSPIEVVKTVFSPKAVTALAQSTASFPLLLANVMNKALRAAYEEAPKTWPAWVRRATNPDFKAMRRLTFSGAPNLLARLEGAPVDYATFSEAQEQYTLVEYARGEKLTRIAIINDDLSAFTRIPNRQANAAARLEDTVVYLILTANANMADGNALFSAAHANLVAVGAGAAPSVATLNAMRTAMRTQVGLAGELINITPSFLIAPAALEGGVKALLRAEADPAAAHAGVGNIWQGGLTPVIEPRLDATSITAWYTAAANSQVDTVEICFLESEQTPQLKQEVDFDTDDVKYVVRHTVAAKAIDWRGLYCNAGV